MVPKKPLRKGCKDCDLIAAKHRAYLLGLETGKNSSYRQFNKFGPQEWADYDKGFWISRKDSPMRIYPSSISCGLHELYVGDTYPKQKDFDLVMERKNRPGRCGQIIASLTHHQVGAIKLLKENGFTQLGEAAKNPNTGNTIYLFIKNTEDAGKPDSAR